MIPAITFGVAAVAHIIFHIATVAIYDLAGASGCSGELCFTPLGNLIEALRARPSFSADYILNGLPSIGIAVWDCFSYNYAILNAGSEPWSYVGVMARLAGAAVIGSFFGSLIYAWASGRR